MDIISNGIQRRHMNVINKVRFLFLHCSNREQIVGEVRAKNPNKHQNGGKFKQIIKCTDIFYELANGNQNM